MIYYDWSVDPTMLRAINEISRFQSKPTRNTKKKSRILLDYASTHPNEIILYKESDMILHVHSDEAYLTMPGARS